MAELEPLRLADLYRMGDVRAMAISADGRAAAVIWQGFRKEADERYESLFLVPTAGSGPAHQLSRTASHESAPAFSLDGRYLAVLSTRPDEMEVAEAKAAQKAGAQPKDSSQEADSKDGDGADEPRAQVWIYDLVAGGEPRQVTSWEEGVQSFSLAPDGLRLVFAAPAPTAEEKSYLKALKKGKAPFVLTRTQHKMDGEGFTDPVLTHLFIADVASREVRPLTTGPASEGSPLWSPAGGDIAFLSNRTGDPDNNRRQDAWLIRPDATGIRRLTQGDVEVWAAAFSLDGQQMALVVNTHPEDSYGLYDLAVVPVAKATPVPDFTRLGDGFSSVGGLVPDRPAADPVRSARVYPVPTGRSELTILTADFDRPIESRPQWDQDGTIWALAGDRGQTRLARISTKGVAWVFPADRMTSLRAFGRSGQVTVVATASDSGGPELRRLGADGQSALLWAPLAPLLVERQLGSTRRFSCQAPDGPEVECFALFPPGHADGSAPLPAVVMIHGGPMAYDEPGLAFDEQVLLAHGYLVLKVNYRGSTSYGESFCRSIQGDWGPREHADVMACLDAAIDQGWADPTRLFITGFSQGGIMTNWAVGHTDRFRAGVSEHGMWDYVAAFGTDDCHLWWQDDLGVPWQNEATYRRISPASAAANIHTPLLITAGEHDWRCPLDQAELLYMTLKKRGVPTALVVYQDEHHAISKPKRAIDRVLRMLRWFAAYGGQPVNDATAEGFPSPTVD